MMWDGGMEAGFLRVYPLILFSSNIVAVVGVGPHFPQEQIIGSFHLSWMKEWVTESWQ